MMTKNKIITVCGSILVASVLFTQCAGPVAADMTQILSLVNSGQRIVIPKYLYTDGVSAIAQYKVDRTTGLLTALGAATGVPASIAQMTGDPLGRFFYLAHNVGNSISAWSINQSTGIVSIVGQMTQPNAFGIAVDPSGSYLFASGSTGFMTYSINQSTGALTLVSTLTPGATWSLSVHPSGRFLYSGAGTYYSIGVGGVLTSLGAFSGAGGTFDPTGQFFYNLSGGNVVAMYTVNQSTGAMTSIGTIPTAAGTGANGCTGCFPTYSPNGRFLYATQSTGISVYRIGATGSLTLAGSAEVGSASQPVAAAIDPTSKYLFMLNYASPYGVKKYSINQTDGPLSVPSGSVFIAAPANNPGQAVATSASIAPNQ